MLRLQTEAKVPGVFVAFWPFEGTWSKVCAKYLYTRLRGKHLHDTARFWITEPGGQRQFARFFFGNNHAMVITAIKLFFLDLRYAFPNRMGLPKIDWSSIDRSYFPRGDQCLIS